MTTSSGPTKIEATFGKTTTKQGKGDDVHLSSVETLSCTDIV